MSHSGESFRDRKEAGELLANELKYLSGKNVVVLGIPRGGIIVAAEVARVLAAKLDIVLSRKIGAPGNPELAIGSIGEDGKFFLNEGLALRVGADKNYIESERIRQLAEIKNRIKKCRQVKPKVSLEGQTVIIIDDGVATGATMQAALLAAGRQKAKKVIAAIPVGAKESIDLLADYADELIVLRVPGFLGAIGEFYENFEQTSEEEVLSALREAAENEKKEARMCKTCGCSPCKCGRKIVKGVCQGCGKKNDECSCAKK
ncbi:MAG: phosphoribosyltransferase family protein [Candidatus Omnitrophica bacterium]|nr:phosphoribosyltransferase family protein [Candidatus Omnitrophota bacterium]